MRRIAWSRKQGMLPLGEGMSWVVWSCSTFDLWLTANGRSLGAICIIRKVVQTGNFESTLEKIRIMACCSVRLDICWDATVCHKASSWPIAPFFKQNKSLSWKVEGNSHISPVSASFPSLLLEVGGARIRHETIASLLISGQHTYLPCPALLWLREESCTHIKPPRFIFLSSSPLEDPWGTGLQGRCQYIKIDLLGRKRGTPNYGGRCGWEDRREKYVLFLFAKSAESYMLDHNWSTQKLYEKLK